MRRIVIERNALADVVGYVREAGYEEVTLVADANTYALAGEKLHLLFEDEQVRVGLSAIRENEMGEVAADEEAIVQLMLDTSLTSQAAQKFAHAPDSSQS